jgi:hypothetical protein
MWLRKIIDAGPSLRCKHVPAIFDPYSSDSAGQWLWPLFRDKVFCDRCGIRAEINSPTTEVEDLTCDRCGKVCDGKTDGIRMCYCPVGSVFLSFGLCRSCFRLEIPDA